MAIRSSPERPLLKPWYRLARVEDRIALDYGHSAVVLEGEAAATFLPALLPLLDGTRSREDLAEALGRSTLPAVDHALDSLAEAGLLAEGPPLGADLPLSHAGAAHLLAARGPLSPAETASSLAQAVVGIAGSGPLAEAVVRLLRLSGVGEAGRVAFDASAEELEPVALALVVPAPGELAHVEGWNRAALEAGQPWLPVLPFDGRYAAVGPLCIPGETCCFECYRLRRAANIGYPEEFWALERAPAAFPCGPALEQVVAGVAVDAALRWLVHRDPELPGVLLAVEAWETLRVGRHHVYRVPRCPACSSAAVIGAPSPWFEGEPDARR